MSEARNRPRACARLRRAARACALLALLATAAGSALAQTTEEAPVLLIQPNSLRAVALDSVTFKPEPFSPTAAIPWMSADNRTRVMLFARGLRGASAGDLLVEAEDGAGRRHTLTVEFVGLVPDLAPQDVSQVVVRLADGMDNVGDVLVKLTRSGVASNRARLAMGFFGGGPPDEAIKITGRVATADNAAVVGAILTLTGAVNALALTDADGNYSFPSLPPAGNYTVSVSKLNHSFDPPARAISNLLGEARADFVASLMGFRISGRITEFGRPFAGVRVNLTGSRTESVTTDSAGSYSFIVPADGNYAVAPESQSHTFSPASLAVHNLGADQAQDFTAIPLHLTYSISGFITLGPDPLPGVAVTLSGSRQASTVTDSAGFYTFPDLIPGGNYAVTAAKLNHAFTPPSQVVSNLLGAVRADFVASLMGFRISGRITEFGRPFAGVRVNLTGSLTESVTTDAEGNYSFIAPADGNYVVAPASDSYSFSPASLAVHNLGADQTRDFTATPVVPTFTISGFARRGSTPLSGAAMFLTGTRTGGVVTNASGFYSFVGLPGEGSYTVTAEKAQHTFAPPSATFDGLGENKRADFAATLNLHTITGQITENGVPVPGLRVDLGGDLFATTTTDAQGNFSFTGEGGGNYVVMPVAGNRFFSPWSVSINNLSEARSLNFVSTLVPAVDFNVFYVLDFDGSPQTVDYGEFFHPRPGQTQLGKFFWEFWAKPGTNAFSRYMLSDGYGGAHALLFGFTSGRGDGRYWPYGNVWNGRTAIEFGGDDGPAPNEWGHMAVGWDGQFIYTYYNGVPSGLTPFTGPRMPGGSGNGAGKLFIGGSDHSNFMGRIAQVRGFEDANPRDGGVQAATFRPDTVFGLTPGTRPTPASSFLTSFLKPGLSVPDLAGGRVGVLRGTAFTAPEPTRSYPLPQFVIDPAAPTVSLTRPPVPPAVHVDQPQPPPNGAAVFDSFSRRNATYAFDGHGGLGRTEVGDRQWHTAVVTGGVINDEAFGILNGRAVALSDFGPGCLAWVEMGPASGQLRVVSHRTPGHWKSGLDTGVVFRVQNSANFFFAHTNGDPLDARARKLTVGYWLGGHRTQLAVNVQMPAVWTRLQVVTTPAGLIEVFADETLVYTTTTDILAGATGAGLYNDSDTHALHNRWDNFTVLTQP